jgi:methylase of polypeptide subunit release factors
LLLIEFGAHQLAKVLALAARYGFVDTMTYKDLSGLDRVLAARMP